MQTRIPLIAAGLALALSPLAAWALPLARGQDPARPLRIGVYDNRAIAIAFAPSEHNPAGEWAAELRRAEDAGDAARRLELGARLEKLQRQLHRQGFGRVPVDDLLAHVAGGLPAVARRAGVIAIAPRCDHLQPGVETVDVTRELVMLFEPSERTLRFVEELAGVEPVDLDELERGHEH